MGLRDIFKKKGNSNSSSGGNVSDAVRFKNLYSAFVGPNGKMDATQFNTVLQLIMKWRHSSPNDLNCALALILLKAPGKNPSEVRAQVANAKKQFTADDPSMVSWFENEIEKRI